MKRLTWNSSEVGVAEVGGQAGEPRQLASCYRESLGLATGNGLASIAFPNISTGVYGYPKADAARIAVAEVNSYLQRNELPTTVIFCVFDDENYRIYNSLLG